MPIGAFKLNAISKFLTSVVYQQSLYFPLQTSPYIHIYNRSGDTFTKLTNPSSLPTSGNSQTHVAVNSDGTSFAITMGVSPYINIYNRSGDTFTKLSNPASLPTGECHGVGWSPNGNYLAVAHDTTPYMTVYSRSGNTFTKLTNPTTLPGGSGEGLAWNHDSTSLAIGYKDAVRVYTVSGSTLTLAATITLSGVDNYAYDLSWNSTGTSLAVAHSVTPYISVYNRSGNTFTKISNPATLPTGGGFGVAWNPAGTSLAVAHTTTPYVTIYNRSGDTLTKLTNPATLPTGNAQGVAWNSDGTSLAVAHNTTPYVTIYNRSSDTFTKLTNPATLPGSQARNLAWSSTIFKRTSNPITTFGNAQVSTAQSKFGGASALFDGTGDYLEIPKTTDLTLTSQSTWTVEMWVRFSDVGVLRGLIGQQTGGNVNNYGWGLYRDASNRILWYSGAGTFVTTSGFTSAANTWYHVAVVRDGTSMKIFVNGTQYYTTSAYANSTDSAANIAIGFARDYASNLWSSVIFYQSGYIDEVRISNSARYTANFTAPTAAFTNDSNTILLVHADGTNASTSFFDDNS